MSVYIKNHWQGHHSLTRSLVLNTITFNVCMVLVFSYLTNWIEANWPIADNTLLVLLIVFWSVVLVWQGVGAFRAASLRIQNYGSVSNYYGVFAVMLGCTLFTFASIATQYGDQIDYVQQGVDEYRPPAPAFELEATATNQLVLTGEIGYGATEKLDSLLKQHPQSTLLILNSEGGLIVESRGVANAVKKHGLNTRVTQRCYSACTIAFIAGNQRSLAKNAQLGFHQYNLVSASSMPWINPTDEQEKDLHYFFEKDVPGWFMERAYSTPHSSIWTPSVDELYAAGVITTKSDSIEQQ